tara:strand:+ start:859 stop:1050 length:192 start_codon:yes stop_codon:yes gene_type:complete
VTSLYDHCNVDELIAKGDTLVKLGWILLGFRMVLLVPGRELLTTPVEFLSVNGRPLMLASGTH